MNSILENKKTKEIHIMQIGKHTIKIRPSKHKIKSKEWDRLNMGKFYSLIDTAYLLIDLHSGLAE